jgi:ABC-type dipeptide/oligopeptide/nickel transport system ATPase component
LEEGETLAIVGESGCEKSVSALSLMRLIPNPPGEVVNGKIIFMGKDLLTLSEEAMRGVRGRNLGMVLQEPMATFANLG